MKIEETNTLYVNRPLGFSYGLGFFILLFLLYGGLLVLRRNDGKLIIFADRATLQTHRDVSISKWNSILCMKYRPFQVLMAYGSIPSLATKI